MRISVWCGSLCDEDLGVMRIRDDVHFFELLVVLVHAHGLGVVTHLDEELVKIAPDRSDLKIECLTTGIQLFVAILEHIEGPIPRIGNPNFKNFSTTSLG